MAIIKKAAAKKSPKKSVKAKARKAPAGKDVSSDDNEFVALRSELSGLKKMALLQKAKQELLCHAVIGPAGTSYFAQAPDLPPPN